MKNSKSLILSVLLIVSSGELANSHSMIALDGVLQPRSTSSGIKTGPCGSAADPVNPGKTIVTLIPGQQLVVKWIETIFHPGYFRIAYCPTPTPGETNFCFDSNVILDNIAHDAGNPSVYTRTITVPLVPCENCTIQLVQFMLENPAAPSLYFSCADIRISATGGTPPPTATPSATPIPTATPKITTTPKNCI